MADKTGKDSLKEGLDRLEEVNVGEISDKDLDSVAGGYEAVREDFAAEGCNSSWCCSNSA